MSDLVEVIPASNLAIISKVELDSAISTAKHYPRSVSKFIEDAKEIVTSSVKIAASCMYARKQKEWDSERKCEVEKIIEGKSIRLAEIIFSCYGNLKAGVRIKGNDGQHITVEGIMIDLEKNNTISMEEQRSIRKKNKDLYSSEMQVTATKAASAIVFRNNIFKIVPMAIVDEIYDAAVQFAVGNEKDLPERREKCLLAFKEIGITEETVVKLVKRKNITEITLDDLRLLIGIYNAKKDGVFDPDDEQNKNEAAKNLSDRLAN